MIGALWILAFTVVAGFLLYLGELRWRRRHNSASTGEEGADAGDASLRAPADSADDASGPDDADGQCCGLHLVCEKDSLSPMSANILYYDDEELDRFIGRDPHSYTADEVEEFRDVLMTLRPDDLAGWARSVTQRRLELPPDVRDELLMLVNEQRNIS